MENKQALIRYLKWLQGFNPVLYAAAKVTHPEIFENLKGVGLGATDTENEPWYATALNTVADAVKAFVPIYQQKKILDTQLQLAKSGQPMLSNEQIAQAGTTSIQVQLPDDIKDEVVNTAKAAQSGINWTVIALLGGGIFLLTQMKPKRGRR